MTATYRGDGIVVANPTSNPEMAVAASVIARAGQLRRYHAPIVAGDRVIAAAGRMRPQTLGLRVARQLRRREAPEGVPPSAIKLTATVPEGVRLITDRAGVGARYGHNVAEWQARQFDRAVARGLRRGDDILLGCMGTITLGVATAASLGMRTVLDVPMVHPAWLRALMREEARRVPAYAGTLQGHDLTDRFIGDAERELATAHDLLVLSTHSRATLEAYGIDPVRMRMTVLGVDTEAFMPQVRSDDGVFRVIFVGQITQRKGLSYLIEAFQSAAIPNSELLLVGAVVGGAKPWLGTPGVRWLSARSRSLLPALYATADVFVLPSLAEGFPLTQMEAMAMAIPVIVSEHTSAHDVVRDGTDGWVVPIRDSDAIAERLRVLYANPARRQAMGAAARRRAEVFTWRQYGDRLTDVLMNEAR